MKKINAPKILFIGLFSLFLNYVSFSQTTLNSGDIVITGFNTDNPDQFSFLLLTEIEANTSIKFTDNGWQINEDDNNESTFRDKEGVLTWTTATFLPCGIEISILDLGSNTYSATYGSVEETNPGFSLAVFHGDQILAYQGEDSSPTFLYAINFDNEGWSNADSSNNTALPTGLTNNTNAISLGQTDNAVYNCAITSGTSSLLSAISNPTNWILDNNRIDIQSCFYSCVSCPGGTVTWNGSWTSEPNIDTQVIISDDYNTAVESSFSAGALKIENNAKLTIANTTHVTVQNDLLMESGTTLTVEHSGAFVQNSNESHITNNGVITKNKVTASANNWYEYTYWSSPVTNATISNGLTNTQPGRRFLFNAQNYLDAYKEVNNNNTLTPGQDGIDDNGDAWQVVYDNTLMIPGIGYASNHSISDFNARDETQFEYNFEGTFNNGEITVPIFRNDSETNDYNWNLIGNPYPSAIDADLFLQENTYIDTNISGEGYTDGAIYLWSHNTPPSSTANGNQKYNFDTSDYAIINGTGQIAGGDGIIPNRFIPSCQSFFIAMSNDAPATQISENIYSATITFNNNMRVSGATDNSQFFKSSKSKTSSKTNKLWLQLEVNKHALNQILIGYINGATNNDDGPYYDATLNSYSNKSPRIYSTINNSNKKYGIQGKAEANLNKDEIIQVGFSTPIDQNETYQISISNTQGPFFNSNPIYINDKLLNTTHNLSETDYVFTSEKGEFNSRFEIVFTPNNVLTTSNEKLNNESLKIVHLNKDILQFNVSKQYNIKSIKLYDMLGQQIISNKVYNSSTKLQVSQFNNSIYITKVELTNGQILTKKLGFNR